MTAQACKTMEEELAKCLKENAENQVKSRDLFFCPALLSNIKDFRIMRLERVKRDQAFELEDYTNCGELEKFVSQIEDVLQEWNLTSLNR